ncbi:50S ribosomal protein L5 [Candidatus Woesearchaeota archaeon]|nr:50S ribosomal protein L5 [Candidatus Woesearchaeota archaeon]
MKGIRIEKLVLNIGTGKNPDSIEKAMKLLKSITGREPVKTITKKRIPEWGLRPGLAIGCKVTLRKALAKDTIARLLQARDNKLSPRLFDDTGNLAFGIPEYIDIPGVSYDPQIGVIGLQATITLERVGYGIKRRKSLKRPVPVKHRITKQEAVEFMQRTFDADVGEEE